ncbi:hypothetical protein ElyMa_004106100 [Elysia marginata]|uniref:Uncharacterized protein n=1 Tax=Elysia marginata TaxID=1093978 RepID=A0AAV4GC05_9GAST|nr:hypothetical protein ElyMa_004106100 [Elysia marginata]
MTASKSRHPRRPSCCPYSQTQPSPLLHRHHCHPQTQERCVLSPLHRCLQQSLLVVQFTTVANLFLPLLQHLCNTQQNTILPLLSVYGTAERHHSSTVYETTEPSAALTLPSVCTCVYLCI